MLHLVEDGLSVAIPAAVPVDLNAQLFRYEQDLADLRAMLGRDADAAAWRARASTRRDLINQQLWVADEGIYRDLDLRTGRPLQSTPRAVSAFVPLWAGLVTPSRPRA